MAYSKTTWSDEVTPVNASNLNKIEDALEDMDTRIDALNSFPLIELGTFGAISETVAGQIAIALCASLAGRNFGAGYAIASNIGTIVFGGRYATARARFIVMGSTSDPVYFVRMTDTNACVVSTLSSFNSSKTVEV